ncbi:MAG: cell division protein FtsQ/DivIB [Chitinophagaceae bacterium]
MFKQGFKILMWGGFGTATVLLLVAAMQQKEHKPCSAINIEINSTKNNAFIDEKEVAQLLKSNGALVGKDISTINLRNIESNLSKDAWIKNAELFFDNNQILQVKIEEREPLARIFSLEGNSFYIDSSGLRLPLSEQQTARVPVFTSFTSDRKILSAPDSSLLNDVKNIASFIGEDSFWSAQISQINITPQRTFEMVPVIGNQIIEIGNADSLQSKFDRLFSFYKNVFTKSGFEKYEKIDVQFDGQVVATLRGVKSSLIDSSKAMHQLNNSASKMNSLLNDTTYAAPVISVKDTSLRGGTTKQSVTFKTKPAVKIQAGKGLQQVRNRKRC